MNNYEIRFGGFGGQGVVLAGVILAKTASLVEGKNAVQTQLYGPDSRGGAAKSEVIISEKKIDYPKVDQADLLVLMSQEAADKYASEMKKNSLIIYDPELVILNESNVQKFPVKAAKIAGNLGNKITANMVMLGAVSAASKIVSLDSLLKIIEESVPKHAIQLNINAAKEGYNALKELKEKGWINEINR